MNQRTLIAGGALALVAGVGLFYTRSPADLPLPQPGEVKVAPSLSARHADGGVAGCVAKFSPDGGRERVWRRLAACDCVRRPAQAEAADCRWRRAGFADAGESVVDVPVGFRFAADASVGTGCQPVACSILAGENPNE